MKPREGYLKSGGYKIHYLIWGGTGPKLVFIHSMGMDAHGFDLTTESMASEYQILALTILDHGDSQTLEEAIPLPDHAEIMRDCYRQIGFEPNVLVGHSVGGMMGIILAAEHPGEIKGLVLVDIAPFELTGRMSRPPPPDFFASEDEAREYLRHRYPGFTYESIENRISHALTKDEKGRLKLKPRGETMMPSLAIDLWPYVEKMKAPTFLMIRDVEPTITEETQERMKGLLDDLEVITVEDTTHMIPQDDPEAFETLLRAFLEKVT